MQENIEKKQYLLDEDNIPYDNKVYKEKEYWEQRFEKEENYDWIGDLNQLEKHSDGLIEEFVNIFKKGSVLNLGCGNSNMSSILFDKGVQNITNCDYSSVLIEKMKQNHPQFSWVVADITQLEQYFQPNSFDNIIEKCTIDALTVDAEDLWNPNEKTKKDIQNVFEGAYRLLKNGGIFISLSFEQPHFRKKYFTTITNLFQVEQKRKINISFKECYVYYFTKIEQQN